MIEYKQGQNARVSVRLLDALGAPVPGVTSGSASATIERSDGTTTVLALSGSNWDEVTDGDFNAQGVYDLILPATATNLPGVLNYAVSAPGSRTCVRTIKIVANEEADTFARLGLPIGASISADIAQVAPKTWNELTVSHQAGGSVGRLLNDLWRLFGNKAIINPTTMQLEIYNDAGNTVIFAFDLKDHCGVASSTKHFQRHPAT